MLLRLVRVARLFKLIRLSKFQRIYVRCISRISIKHETMVKLKVVVLTICVVHWYTCIFALSASMHSDPRDTYFYRIGFCTSLSSDDYDPTDSETLLLNFAEECNISAGRFYVASFTWALLLVTGSGGTATFPTNTSTAENLVLSSLKLFAGLFWTIVLALFCEMITNRNPEVIDFQQTLDELEIFMSNHDVPQNMRQRLREFFHQRKHVRIAERAFLVTRKMSAKLQAEVITLVYGSWLSRIFFLRGLETSCVMPIAMAMRPVTYAPSESPQLHHFYIIMRGIVSYGPQYMRLPANRPRMLSCLQSLALLCTTRPSA